MKMNNNNVHQFSNTWRRVVPLKYSNVFTHITILYLTLFMFPYKRNLLLYSQFKLSEVKLDNIYKFRGLLSVFVIIYFKYLEAKATKEMSVFINTYHVVILSYGITKFSKLKKKLKKKNISVFNILKYMWFKKTILIGMKDITIL